MKPQIPLVLVLVVAASPARAWDHHGTQWQPESMPIVERVADDGAPNTIEACEASDGVSGCCEETVPAGYCIDAVTRGFAAWDEVSCVDVEHVVLDPRTAPGLAWPNRTTNDLSDQESSVTFNDPSDVLGPGVIASQITERTGETVIVRNRLYQVQIAGDVSFNDNVEFVTVEELASGDCPPGAYVMDAVAAHAFGHQLGIAHSCENPDLGEGPCTDPALLEATMYWKTEPCSDAQLTVEEDDEAGLKALYGPTVSFVCANELTGGVVAGVPPFEVRCALTSEHLDEITSAEWDWGDGQVSEGTTASHTYTEPGNYTVEVWAQGEQSDCDWQEPSARVGSVRACGAPEPAFALQRLDGLRYQLLNESDVSVFGCLTGVQWDVFVGDSPGGERVGEPITDWEPEIAFPGPGTYHVVLSLGGVAGTRGASATFEVSEGCGGCASGGLPTGGGLALLGLLALRRRR